MKPHSRCQKNFIYLKVEKRKRLVEIPKPFEIFQMSVDEGEIRSFQCGIHCVMLFSVSEQSCIVHKEAMPFIIYPCQFTFILRLNTFAFMEKLSTHTNERKNKYQLANTCYSLLNMCVCICSCVFFPCIFLQISKQFCK